MNMLCIARIAVCSPYFVRPKMCRPKPRKRRLRPNAWSRPAIEHGEAAHLMVETDGDSTS